MDAYDAFKVRVLQENAHFLFGQQLFKEALEDAEEAYRLGQAQTVELINLCNKILAAANDSKLPAQLSLQLAVPPEPKLLSRTVTMELESLVVSVVKSAKVEEASDAVLRVWEAQNLFRMLDLPYPAKDNLPSEKHLEKIMRKMLLRIHPDKCQDKRAADATAKLTGEYAEYLKNPIGYLHLKKLKVHAAHNSGSNDNNSKAETTRPAAGFNHYHSKFSSAPPQASQARASAETPAKKKFGASNEDPVETTRSNGRRKFAGK